MERAENLLAAVDPQLPSAQNNLYGKVAHLGCHILNPFTTLLPGRAVMAIPVGQEAKWKSQVLPPPSTNSCRDHGPPTVELGVNCTPTCGGRPAQPQIRGNLYLHCLLRPLPPTIQGAPCKATGSLAYISKPLLTGSNPKLVGAILLE